MALAALTVVSCGAPARLPVSAEMGPHPVILPPKESLIPVMKVFKAVGWPGDEAPIAAVDLTVRAFARGLDHPRWLYVLPNGDVLATLSEPGYAVEITRRGRTVWRFANPRVDSQGVREGIYRMSRFPEGTLPFLAP